jgi:hypothetical protein
MTLRDLAGPGLVGLRKLVGSYLVKRTFSLDSALMLASTINEAVASHLNQKCAKMRTIGKAPSCLPKATQDICPDRLHNIHGVELGT